ncbi:MAG: coniferyl-alcohol dehydrogenase [Actinomycetota bacterium]
MTRLLDFTDKTIVITGAASGIGAATAELAARHGAEVHTIDVVPVEVASGRAGTDHRCDLGRRAAIDAVIDALPDRIDTLMNCAGVPNGGRFTPETVMRVNWLGLRHLTEAVLPRVPDGGAVVHVASTAGRHWADRVTHHRELMAATTFGEGDAWLAANADVYGDGYSFSKEAVQFYTMWRAVQLLPRGVRMNSLCPGVTATPISDDFRRGLGDDVIDHATAVAGRMADPAEMAPTMLFLADHASTSYLNGVNVHVDRGTAAARATDQSDPSLIWGPPG